MSNEDQEKHLEKMEKESSLTEVSLQRPNYAFARTTRENLREVAQYLKDEGFVHVTTISGVDLIENFEIVYHLRKEGFALNLKVAVPKDDPKVPSITDILNGAVLYEREVNDLLGVFPEGHPNPARLILDYDWPEGVHPLRKEETLDTLREKADGKKWGRNVE